MHRFSLILPTLVSLLALLASPVASQVQQPQCRDTALCTGSCPATYICTPRVTSNCVNMLSTGNGEWKPSNLNLQCGVCAKSVFGVVITSGVCGSSCIDPCLLEVV